MPCPAFRRLKLWPWVLSVGLLFGEYGVAQTQQGFSQSASADAAPTWASSKERQTPQLEDPLGLFQSLRHGESDDIRRGVLVCNVQVTHPKRWDSFAAPDLDVTLTLGKGSQAHKTFFKGPQDRSVFTFSLPLVNLVLGTKVGVSLTDRDVFQHEFIGNDVDVFAGSLPLTFDSGTFTGECRALFGEALAHRVKERGLSARTLLTQFMTTSSPRADHAYLGLDRKNQKNLHRHLVYFAALTGWQDDRLQQFLDEEDAFGESFASQSLPVVQKLRRKAVKAAQKKKNATWEKDRLRISAPALLCAPELVKDRLLGFPKSQWTKKAECVVVVSVEKRTGGKSALPPHSKANGLRVLQADGHVVELQSIGFSGAPVQRAREKAAKSASPKNQHRAAKKAGAPGKQKKKGAVHVHLERGDNVTWILVPKTPLDGDELLLRVPNGRKVETLFLQ